MALGPLRQVSFFNAVAIEPGTFIGGEHITVDGYWIDLPIEIDSIENEFSRFIRKTDDIVYSVGNLIFFNNPKRFKHFFVGTFPVKNLFSEFLVSVFNAKLKILTAHVFKNSYFLFGHGFRPGLAPEG